ncbi:FHA domain-containing protein (plasmid) [Deinococcus psychrotolerans]|uniref:FHA domain-containing protein n=1 Tax=Deinococcus psychrotolerans TaxID=2489213 RepID=A0A3G8YHQ5_9DEIO|nr:phage tail protein [Deinococcus psychrotolerans]AZI44505.1 FHA domain-containing protein [Deinococcus psychrotolerans]
MPDQLFVQLQGDTLKMLSLDMNLLSIGRTPDNGLALPNAAVAIRHAEVRRQDNRFVLTDLGNGETYLGSLKLAAHQPQILEEGALIRVGPYVLAYVANSDVLKPPDEIRELPVRRDFQIVPVRPPRALHQAPKAEGKASAYLDYLPTLFSESEFLGRYLMIFQTIWEPLQHRQDHLEMYFSPSTAPSKLVDWFAAWLGLEVDPLWPEDRKRQWLREAMSLMRSRGTRYGLVRAIELGCGVTPLVIEDPKKPFWVTVILPDPDDQSSAAGGSATSRENAERLIAQHLPAHVQYELRFVGQADDQRPSPT